MRLSIPSLLVLTALAAFASTAEAQYSLQSPMVAQAGNAGYGYYVPVVTNGYAATPAAYSMHISDGDEQAMPMVSSDCGAGCSCSGCDSRYSRGCGFNCNCLRCRHDKVFSNAFGSLEYLHWWNKGISLPPLVTSNVGGIPAQGVAGVLGVGTTSVLFGNETIDDELQAGARLNIGWWLDDCCNLALGAKLYGVENGAVGFNATSAGVPVLARPFFNSDAFVNAQDALLVAYPGVTTGSIAAVAENDVFGMEIYGRSLLDSSDCYRLDLIGGYQFNRIDSDLAIASTSNAGGLGSFFFADSFDVENQYHAGAAGLYIESYHDVWTFSALGKIALGNMRQSVVIDGTNSVTAGGVTVQTAGGLLAQPTNIGAYERDVLTWAPEANFKLSCAVTQRLSVSVGYSFLYFTRVAFAGDQVDLAVNATQLNGGAVVGPARPAFTFRDTDFWVQTVDIGVSWNY